MLALKHLTPEVRLNLMPLIDVASPTKEADLAVATKYLLTNIARAAKALNGISAAFVDSSELDPSFRLPGDVHPLLSAAHALQAAGIRPVPVTGLHRDIDHRAATKDIATNAELKQICIRLDSTDISTATLTFKRLKALLSAEGFTSEQVYLTIDLQCLYAQELEPTVTHVTRFLNLANELTWAGIVVGGYGIPDQISSAVSTKGEAYLPRIEQQIFDKVSELDLDSLIWFTDYTVIPPSVVELDWRIMSKVMSPKAIYALEEEWFVVRGGAFASHPDAYAQYFSLAKKIVDLEEFCGDDHCYGCKYILERSKKLGKPGSPGSWITACVNHHVTLTAMDHAD